MEPSVALDPQQRAAVLAGEGPLLVLAGAGSGKTRVIAERILRLVRDRGVDARSILAVTFTNKAAAEMRSRVAARLSGASFGGWICTFHGFCARVLRREPEAAGLPRDFVILDEGDQLAAMRQALRDLDLSETLHPPRRVLSAVSAWKNSAPRRGGQADPLPLRAAHSRAAERYQAVLLAAHALDFDDLLIRVASLFERDSTVRDRWRALFRFVLVDEYQDTNPVQDTILRLLVGPSGNLTVVGDEDQSIYSWRGATIRNILEFERDYPGARIVRLEHNYRSSQAVLDAATALVAHNRKRRGKVLRAARAGGAPVFVHAAADEHAEAAWVVGRLASLPVEGRAAILFRTNAQSRVLEEALARERRHYVVVGTIGFYERKEVRDALAFLRVALNPRDSVALRRVINVPPRGIGSRTVVGLEAVAAQRGCPLWDVVSERAADGCATPALAGLVTLVEELRCLAPGASPKALLEAVLEKTGYLAWLGEAQTPEARDRIDNLSELVSAAARRDDDDGTIAAFLDRASLVTPAEQDVGDAPTVLMTLHAAKGLEFETVFIVGLEEGLLPHERALDDPDGLEEERRLCYVGMTRARTRLYLSSARVRLVSGRSRACRTSRFLGEIDGASSCVSAGGLGMSDAFRQSPTRAVGLDLHPGAVVRHPEFGIGTVLRRDGSGDDLKVTVSFPRAGTRRLVVRYAALEPS
jgi:DNA helicase-2/ATP-dependent DNA helicase PcrA